MIAESLKRWASHNKFVADKLAERLKHPLDDLDQKIANIVLNSKGQIDLKSVPKEYEYNMGTGEVKTG